MITDGVLTIKNTKREELHEIEAMERDEETSRFIIPYSLERHLTEFKKEKTFYKSILAGDNELIGCMIFSINDVGDSFEFRRLVIKDKGKGYGKRAVKLADRIAREEFGCKHIWLDVFEFNQRGRHIYEQMGYRFKATSRFDDKTLMIYEKTL